MLTQIVCRWEIFKRFFGSRDVGSCWVYGSRKLGQTDLAGGARYEYQLLFCNTVVQYFLQCFLQHTAIRLGVVTGKRFGRSVVKIYFHPIFNYFSLVLFVKSPLLQWILAEVFGISYLHWKLLFGIPLTWGVAITALDVIFNFVFLFEEKKWEWRRFFISSLIFVVPRMFLVLNYFYLSQIYLNCFAGFVPTKEILF